MHRAGTAAIAVLVICCGGSDSDDKTAKVTNRAPLIESVVIHPSSPTRPDALSAAVRAQDPDRDPLELEVVWYRNGAAHPGGGEQSTKPFSFDKGDRVHAVARVSDGNEQVTRRSEGVVIQNSAPQVTGLRLTPDTALGSDSIRALAQGTDVDGDELEYRYRWYVGGAQLGTEGPELPPNTLKRDDQVYVEAAAFDGTDLGPWVQSDALRIGNSAPAITTQPGYTLDSDGFYQYAVNARDPDGDAPLRYELIEAPPGMSVDPASGVVRWNVPRDAAGRYTIELSVSDPYGASTLQRYSLDLSWGAPPADTR